MTDSPTFLKSQRGYTLMEIMVVMVIVALLASAISLRLNAGGQKTLNEEVHRMNRLVKLASEQALLQGRDVGMSVEGNGYSFYLFDLLQQQWLSLDTERVFRSRNLPENIHMELAIEESSVTWPEQEQDEFSLALEGDEEDQAETSVVPQVLMLSSGEITPFDLYFEMDNVEKAIQLHVDIDGTHEIITHEYGL